MKIKIIGNNRMINEFSEEIKAGDLGVIDPESDEGIIARKLNSDFFVDRGDELCEFDILEEVIGKCLKKNNS